MNKCLWKGSRNECESWPYCRGCTWQKKFKEREWERSQISRVRASFSKDWMGNAAKSVTLWASRQNGLLMPWLIVAYALCTTLADHPDTQLIVQTTRLCLKCKATVKVVALWQTACWNILSTTDIYISCSQTRHVGDTSTTNSSTTIARPSAKKMGYSILPITVTYSI